MRNRIQDRKALKSLMDLDRSIGERPELQLSPEEYEKALYLSRIVIHIISVYNKTHII